MEGRWSMMFGMMLFYFVLFSFCFSNHELYLGYDYDASPQILFVCGWLADLLSQKLVTFQHCLFLFCATSLLFQYYHNCSYYVCQVGHVFILQLISLNWFYIQSRPPSPRMWAMLFLELIIIIIGTYLTWNRHATCYHAICYWKTSIPVSELRIEYCIVLHIYAYIYSVACYHGGCS